MQLEILYAKSLKELDDLVNDFMIDKIIYNVNYQHVGMEWQANVFYDDISEGSERE